MRMEGLYYLHETLKNLVKEILEERKPCEIDTTKFRDGENLNVNLVSIAQRKSGVGTSLSAIASHLVRV